MPVIGRNVIRTIYETDETTQKTREAAGNELAFPFTTSQAFYIGSVNKFATRHIGMLTVNTTPANISVDYWDGDAWQPVEDAQDWTNGFMQNGFISWVNQGDWKTQKLTPVTDRDLYYIRLTTDTDLDAGTEIQSVLNLYCDEKELRRYYPELVTDTRFLPIGRTDFIEQFQAAKDEVVLRLKRDKLIRDESQIIDINEVTAAAVHASAWIILNPIAVDDDGNTEAANRAFNNMNYELNQVRLSLDFDKSGVIEDSEKNLGNIFIARG